MKPASHLALGDVRFRGGLLGERIEKVGQVTLPSQWDALNDRIPEAPPSRAVRNLRIAAGDETGEYEGLWFQDSDVAKWLEAACFRLSFATDEKMSAAVEELVGLYERAQEPDGYLHTYHQLTEGAKRWSNLRDLHELYCAGHFIEAAVAHYGVNLDPRLMVVAMRLADLIDRTFGRSPGQMRGYPGHPELELALIKLARVSGEERYLKLADFFVRERGVQPLYFEQEAKQLGEEKLPLWAYFDEQAYWQSHVPVTAQQEPRGHAVRAMYLYAAMADLARETGASDMRESCERLWDEMVAKHLYVIGGIGADGPGGENFSEPFDLPDDRSYAETCAAIGLMMWARRMLDLSLDAKYTEVMERALYNNVLAGLSQDGTHYFYVNPLAVNPGETRRRLDCKMVKTQRVPWFGCACCPPNVARLLSSLGHYAVSRIEAGLAIHLFAAMEIENAEWKIRVKTNYPWQKDVTLEVLAAPTERATLSVREAGAGWRLNQKESASESNRGYISFHRIWQPGDRIEGKVPLLIERVRAHPRVSSASGRVALKRGPMIYAVEEADQGRGLASVGISRTADISPQWESDWGGGVTTLAAESVRLEEPKSLYQSNVVPRRETAPLRAIPYAWWGHRGEGEMRIWLRDYES